MKRDILRIDEELCNGCGLCIPGCHEGALRVIDGKARLISELMCDGLGACIGYCPEGAISIETREAEPYNEIRVMEQIASKGKNTVIAHLRHLKDHGEKGYLNEGLDYIKKHFNQLDLNPDEVLNAINERKNEVTGFSAAHQALKGSDICAGEGTGCPGSAQRTFGKPATNDSIPEPAHSELRHWPVQMHLINPNASFFRGSDLLIAADCVAYSTGGFHNRFLKGKTLVIACPKLDQNTDSYIEKLTALMETAQVNTITAMMMEVPCCGGLLQLIRAAASRASRKVPVKRIIISISGEVFGEEWI